MAGRVNQAGGSLPQPVEAAPGAAAAGASWAQFRGTQGLYLALQLLAALALVLSRALPVAVVAAFPVCPFARYLHVPCAGCGLTRACCAIGHGDFAAAWAYNPFGYVFYAGALAALVWPFVARWRPQWEHAVLRGRVLTIGAVALVGAMWVFGLARILCPALRPGGG
jgi:hypothetical protein